MWEQLRQDSLDGRSERGALLRTVGERFFLRIAIADRSSSCQSRQWAGMLRGAGKNYLVASSAKFNIASEKAPHFRGRFVTPVSDPQMARCQPGICHLPDRSAPASPARTRSDAGPTAFRDRHSRAILAAARSSNFTLKVDALIHYRTVSLFPFSRPSASCSDDAIT